MSYEITNQYRITPYGKVPSEWEIVELGEICEVKGGKRIPKGYQLEDYNTGNPYIRVSDMYMGGVSLNDIKFVPSEIVKYIDNYRISKDDLFISVAGTLGIVGEIPEVLHNANLTENADKLCEIKCDKKYLLYFLQSKMIQDVIDNEKTLNAQPKLALTKIRTFKILYPPMTEQRKIADILFTVDQQIEQTDALIERTKELKKGLMQKLLTKGIGNTEFRDTEIGRIPKGWEVKRLGEVSDINPESLSSKTDPNFVLKYIDIESVTTGKINGTKEFLFIEAPSRARRIVGYNDVIISTVRPYLKAFAIVKSDEENMICSTGFAVIRAVNNNNPDFLFQYTLSDCFINQMSNKMVGSNYPAVNASDVKESLIAVPPINEQKKIAQVLSEIDIQINELEYKKEKIHILKSALMSNLLNGKIRVAI